MSRALALTRQSELLDRREFAIHTQDFFMDAANRSPNSAEVGPVEHNHCLYEQEADMTNEALPVPVAMRVEEILEQEFDALCRIAEDPNATTGILKQTPRRVPMRKRETAKS